MLDNNNVNAAEAAIWQKSLIDAALDAVMIIDQDGRLLDFNPSAEETFGFKKESVIGKLMSDLIIPPSMRQAHVDGVARLKKTRVPKILGKRLELSAIRSDGTEFPVELIVVEVPVKPTPVYVGYVRDISDRKQAEAALLASAERFRSLANSSPLMIWLANRDGDVEWFNRSWLDFTGRELSDVVGDGWMDLMHPEDVPDYLLTYQDALRNCEGFSKEFRLLHVDGSHHWVLANIAPTLHLDGSLAGYAGSCVDITRRREMEMSLRLTQFAMDGAADAVFWLRPDASLHYVNDNACRTLGYDREELMELTPSVFSASNPNENWDTHWQEIKHARKLTFETEHIRKDGSVFPVEITVNHIQFQNKEYACAFARDITERRESQTALAAAMHEAQAANRAKSEFLAIVSHEMRTPLNSILGAIDLSLHDQLSGELREMMSLCRRSGVQLKELINDMLDYSQIKAGRFSLQSNNMDISGLLERIHNLFSRRVQEKGLEFRWQVARDVPSSLVGDARRLSQVIENLLNNAVKFTDSGHVAVRVEVASRSEENVTLSFSVEDTGIGVDRENRERIFRRFEQVDSGPTRAFGGVGLGLSICAQLVELMGGTIDILDREGGGSRFVFTACFDHVTEADRKVDQDREALADPLIDYDFDGVRVLLAEDDPPSCLVARRMLERAGVHVTTVDDGLKAVECFREAPEGFDAIFMDVMMPHLDGIEATRRIRALQVKKVPVIAMTAQAMLGDRERILRSEVDAYIAKPIDQHHVLTTLKDMISQPKGKPHGVRSEQSASPNLFDLDALKKRCGDDPLLLAEVVQLFDQTCEETFERLEAAVEEADQPEVVQAAHRLKGAIGNMCTASAHDHCQHIEFEARDGKITYVASLIPAFKAELLELREALSKCIAP